MSSNLVKTVIGGMILVPTMLSAPLCIAEQASLARDTGTYRTTEVQSTGQPASVRVVGMAVKKVDTEAQPKFEPFGYDGFSSHMKKQKELLSGQKFGQ